MGKRPKDIKSIFSEAIEKKTAEERAAYLDRVCGDDAALRTEFESLLRAYDEAGDFLETPVFDADMPLDDSPVSEAPGTVIGRYKLLEKIGEGGMAVVYMAQQEKPIRRKVAFKIIKWGMDTKNVIARFEAERQVLALMEHPNIAKILDAGSTQTGRPYFVMELVTGISITKYCDKNNLSTKERLELFIQVCHAVQHAHQKGIIHRDIKPSNVMITYHDDKPIPKVIDFGIAKATNQRLTEKTLFTRYAHMIGTPAYMSPEQAQMSDLDIDTRSDIYSLGVLLYELLTGTTPFSEEELRKAGYLEMQRIIAKQEPTKPSTKLNSLGDTLTKIATHHRSTPDLLRKSVRGDLDWIVMKCLEKDRAGRYDTATELAADINRHLGHEPVRAAAPSLLYKSRKFVRRHRMSVLVGLLVSVFILIFLCALSVSTVLIWREQGRTQQALEREQKALNKEIQARTEAERQTKIAQASLDREQKALSQEIQARTEAERQTKIAQAVADFLNNGLLASVDPARARGRQVTVREILDAASQKIEGKFKDEPLIEASVRLTLGNTYMELGEYTEAARQLELAHKMHEEYLPQDHLMALQSMKALSWLYIKQGRYSEAESMLLAVREIGWRVLGEAHPITLGCMNNLGVLYKNQGRYEEAEALYLRTIEIQQRVSGEDNLGTLNTMNNLALLYSDLGRYQEAEVLYKRTLEIKTQRFGEDHPDTLRTMSNLANLVKEQGRYEEAEVLYLKTFEIRIHVLGEEHPDTLGSMNNLAILYFRRGQYKEAEQLYVKTLIIEQRVLGEEHPSTLNCLHNLALLYKEQQRYEESEPLLLKTMETSAISIK